MKTIYQKNQDLLEVIDLKREFQTIILSVVILALALLFIITTI